MRSGLRSIATSIAVLLMLGSVSVSAQNDWIDATHLFDAEVNSVISTLKRETRQAVPARNRALAPQVRANQVGDFHTFWTKNIVENRFEETRAVLKAVGRHCYVFLEEGKTLTAEAIEKVRKNFDEIIYPANTSNFGSEWKPGIDEDERVFLLLFDVKDGYNGTGGFVGGYFYAVDSYLQEKLPAHLKSNEREMIYLDINPSDPASDRFSNTVAHEFQHMIHFNQDSSEYTWVNEACSQIAPHLCGFGHASQVSAFMRTPDNSLTAWAKEQMLANYGQVYLWNYYILNSFLRQDAEGRTMFFKNLVASKKQGIAGYVEALGSISKGFTSTFDRFCIANYVNDERLGKGEFAYDKSLARLKLPVSETVSVFPSETVGEVFLWSADAIKVELKNARSEMKISFQGFRGKMGEDQYNSFTVAMVLTDSTGNNAPKISYIDINPLSGQLQGGSLVVKPEAAFDSALLIVVAQADEAVDDRVYAKAQTMKYTVKITDSGANVVRASTRADVKELVEDYARTSQFLAEADEAEAMIAFGRLESTRKVLSAELLSQLENNSGDLRETIDEMLASGQVNADSIRPLLKNLDETASFHLINR